MIIGVISPFKDSFVRSRGKGEIGSSRKHRRLCDSYNIMLIDHPHP